MFSSVLRTNVARLIVLVLIAIKVEAFNSRSSWTGTRAGRVETKLSAWSLPNPSDLRSITAMKTTWYDECNPTARRTVYNE